jgi:hypothetical protein
MIDITTVYTVRINNGTSSSSSYGATVKIGPGPPPLRFLNHTQLDTHTVGLL